MVTHVGARPQFLTVVVYRLASTGCRPAWLGARSSAVMCFTLPEGGSRGDIADVHGARKRKPATCRLRRRGASGGEVTRGTPSAA